MWYPYNTISKPFLQGLFKNIFSAPGTMREKIQVTLRLPEEVILQIKEEAKRQKRSMNNLLEVIIEEYLKKQQSEQE